MRGFIAMMALLLVITVLSPSITLYLMNDNIVVRLYLEEGFTSSVIVSSEMVHGMVSVYGVFDRPMNILLNILVFNLEGELIWDTYVRGNESFSFIAGGPVVIVFHIESLEWVEEVWVSLSLR